MITFQQIENRFHLDLQHPNPMIKLLYRAVQPGLEHALALPRLSAVAEASDALKDMACAEERILHVLDISCGVDEAEIARIPETGPLLVVANHPFGGVEGLMLASMIKRRRPDVRVMANQLLGQIRQLRDVFLLVDPFASKNSAAANLAPMREALRWLASGAALCVFPAGAVSHLDLRSGRVTDPAWNTTIGRLAQRSGASVLPVYFEGRNSALFQTLGLLHPVLRTVRLPNEFLNKRGLRARAHIGSAIDPARIASFKTHGDVTSYLRIRTELQRPEPHPIPQVIAENPQQLVAAAPDSQLLAGEIASLPDDALLVEHGKFRVYLAEAEMIPHILHEIGRLREITFRANNEGTGEEIDIDRFDAHYAHLFLWDFETQAIAAAYRLGATDRILAAHGKYGLYTRTLFNIRKRLLKQISPALEMGRSFVRQEYQKQFLPLMLLWKGIGTYVTRHPRYRYLFGPVSINNAYSGHAQQLMISFLRREAMDARAHLVTAKTPPRGRSARMIDPKTMSTVVLELSDLSSLIADIESDQKDVPILLKQYLKLGGNLLGFNVDPDFSDVLDGLILVDLTRTEPRMLERYMGEEGVATFLAYHRQVNAAEMAASTAKNRINPQ
jgi:putative hemolysin